MSQETIYQAAGFGTRIPRGTRPAVVVVDFSYGFTDPQYPTASEARVEMAKTKAICDLARAQGFPVVFSTIAYELGEVAHLAWLKKATGMRDLIAGSHLVEINIATGIQPTDPIVVKKGASSFYGSNLAALLTGAGADTLIVCGATTSGCVRATAVDGVQAGFNVLVPADCCVDRAEAPHAASLYDIDQKYGDVTSSKDILDWLQSF